MHVAIIGAGIIGAAAAWRLARAGAEVTVVDAGPPAGGASGGSFGWINASFHLSEAHFHLRDEAMVAWHRAEAELGAGLVNWCGAICWDMGREEAERLDSMGYPVEFLDRARLLELEPALAAPPELAFLFPREGATDAADVTRQLLHAACGHGARLLTGVEVQGIETKGNRVTGLRLPGGVLTADHVVVAAGVGAEALLAPLGVALPLPPRPGLILRSAPQAFRLSHVLVTPEGEIRQEGDGAILMPAAVGHQADTSEALSAPPHQIADEALERLKRVLPGLRGGWRSANLGYRPMPGDGLPALGPAGPEGLTIAVMHSGVTLAALVGEMVTEMVLAGEVPALARPFSPARFKP